MRVAFASNTGYNFSMRNEKGQFVKGQSPWNKGKKTGDITGFRVHKNFSHLEGNKHREGKEPWNKGERSGEVRECLCCGEDFYSIESRKPKYCSKKCFNSHWRGRNHQGWKEGVGYAGIHDWIRSELGLPIKCDNCGGEESKRFMWHNISGEYNRDLSDWQRLCAKCHANHHKNWEGRWKR